MDKRLVGKWYKEEYEETINIFDAEPPRMKMSFASSGYYNYEPNCVYEKDGYLCYEINEEKYRMVYHIKYEDGYLKGYYTQFGKQIPIVYKKVSDISEDGVFEHRITNYLVSPSYLHRVELLKKYAEYDNKETINKVAFEYKLFEEAPKILEKYNYRKYIENYSSCDDELAFSLLNFVCDNFHHDGASMLPHKRGVPHIIEYCESNNSSTNCRGLALLLASLLRMNGIKAAHITCMPYEEPFDECHVVVDCILPSGKRIMFDPSNRLYFKDSAGQFVSLPSLRKILISGEELHPNPDASYNGGAFDIDNYLVYMTKNTMRFSRGLRYADSVDSNDIELVPLGYPIDNFDIRRKSAITFSEREFWGEEN